MSPKAQKQWKPTPDAVMRMATSYLARRATSIAHLRLVLDRGIRRRLAGGDEDGNGAVDIDAVLDAVVARLVQAQLVDDASYATSRARSLAAKGLPGWRVKRDLADKGIAEGLDDLSDRLEPEVQARRFAERKRLGPYRLSVRPDADLRDLRALLRAGFSLTVAKSVLGQTGRDLGEDGDDLNDE